MTGDVVLRTRDLFHTGIVVDDLASAKEELGAATWASRGATAAPRCASSTDDGVRTVQTAYALSRRDRTTSSSCSRSPERCGR